MTKSTAIPLNLDDLSHPIEQRLCLSIGFEPHETERTSKQHFVPAFLGASFLAEVVRRGWVLGDSHLSLETFWIETGHCLGMMFAEERANTIVQVIDGYVVDTMRSRLPDLQKRLREAPMRHFADGRLYRKVHSSLHCFVIPEAWVESLLDEKRWEASVTT